MAEAMSAVKMLADLFRPFSPEYRMGSDGAWAENGRVVEPRGYSISDRELYRMLLGKAKSKGYKVGYASEAELGRRYGQDTLGYEDGDWMVIASDVDYGARNRALKHEIEAKDWVRMTGRPHAEFDRIYRGGMEDLVPYRLGMGGRYEEQAQPKKTEESKWLPYRGAGWLWKEIADAWNRTYAFDLLGNIFFGTKFGDKPINESLGAKSRTDEIFYSAKYRGALQEKRHEEELAKKKG